MQEVDVVEPAFYELSKINRDIHPGHETPVGADLSCAPPIYRPSGTLPGIPVILFDRFWLIDQVGQQKCGRP